jgi:hypothetical protein
MARDFVDVGCTPHEEDCEQLGPDYNPVRAKAECKALIGQLRRMYGEEPFGARLKVTSNPHDFGTYYEVVCEYNDTNEEAANYAFGCEDIPDHWDYEAKKELGLVSE